MSTYLTHPYASPLFGDLSGLPPMLIQSGDSEVLRDEITLLAHKATLAGVNVTHELYEDMIHVFQMFTWLAPAKAAINSVGRWVRVTLPKIQEELKSRGEDINEDQEEVAGLEATEEIRVQEPRKVDQEGMEVEVEHEHDHDQGSLGLNLGVGNVDDDTPTIDFDSIISHGIPEDDDRSSSRSGSPTPTNSPSRHSGTQSLRSSGRSSPNHLTRQHSDLFSSQSGTSSPIYKIPPPSRPSHLRRHTTVAHVSTSARASSSSSPINNNSPIHSPPLRRRRPTAGSASLHVSPAASLHATSNPVSPTPSLRRLLRTPSISLSNAFAFPKQDQGYSHAGNQAMSPGRNASNVSHSQVFPSTRDGFGPSASPRLSKGYGQGSKRGRAQSQSHSDIQNLVEGYVEGGAANETVIYGAGGEVKSVGVLGEGEEK
jgi:hypothetical protein